ncbi:hypothetical protein BS50DRAFT_526400 [Corynespora cassiicola Philippines]|uniref:Uncharacterized protein n=1 Tax=Corynespora cassiicola Philippines TaxID=1448308 RepID=A0A2T2NLR8_CORCC|nr:hypothetical protein BS50DRAFT_526400 [Corynespora cassiicola Philippines]
MSSLQKILICILISDISDVFAADTAENAETIGFVSEDNQRDTLSLLVSCLVTLGLCVYSAVHLNVPSKNESYSRMVWKELKWCLVGLFGPELVLYAAWRQWASAKQLCDEVEKKNDSIDKININVSSQGFNKLGPTSATHDQISRSTSYEWSLSHSFYATMGGFAIELDEKESSYTCLFGEAKRLTLTAKGVALLAHCGHLPNISADDIKDKNKTDSLAKFLVCVQAGWMVVQVTTRRATNLPSTLLEVHTVAHVVCALIVYAIWWHKPRQVESPTLLRGDWLWPLAAYMYCASRMSGKTTNDGYKMIRSPEPEFKELAYLKFEGSNRIPSSDVAQNQQVENGDLFPLGRFCLRDNKTVDNSAKEPESSVPLDEVDEERRRLAAEAVVKYPAIQSRFERSEDNCLIPYTDELVQHYSVNWPNAGLLRRTQSLVMGMVLWGASMVYGAIHVSAWDYFFPTKTERLLWQLSSIWVTFCAAFWLLTNLLAHFFPAVDRVWMAYNERRLNWFWTVVITLLCILCGSSYIVSRAYLVVEAFVSIREVPLQVYNTPSWSQVFPHF